MEDVRFLVPSGALRRRAWPGCYLVCICLPPGWAKRRTARMPGILAIIAAIPLSPYSLRTGERAGKVLRRWTLSAGQPLPPYRDRLAVLRRLPFAAVSGIIGSPSSPSWCFVPCLHHLCGRANWFSSLVPRRGSADQASSPPATLLGTPNGVERSSSNLFLAAACSSRPLSTLRIVLW